MILIWILTSTFIVSLLSLLGALTFALKDAWLKNALLSLLGFSAGALIGTAFLHILPDILSQGNDIAVYYYIILGIVIFFLMEKFFYWRHCHDAECQVHAFTYLNLIGGSMHNFMDGLAIAASFMISLGLGTVTTLAIIFHEIPHELGDFGVLVYGGLNKYKALFYNFLSGLAAMLGALCGYFISTVAVHFSYFVLPVVAGGFIYIAASDLIPELHKENDTKRSLLGLVSFLAGILFMAAARHFLPE